MHPSPCGIQDLCISAYFFPFISLHFAFLQVNMKNYLTAVLYRYGWKSLPDWGHAETTVINCFSLFCPSILLSNGPLPQSLGADLNPWTMKRRKLFSSGLRFWFMPLSNFTLWSPWFPPKCATSMSKLASQGSAFHYVFRDLREPERSENSSHTLPCASVLLTNYPANVTLHITLTEATIFTWFFVTE